MPDPSRPELACAKDPTRLSRTADRTYRMRTSTVAHAKCDSSRTQGWPRHRVLPPRAHGLIDTTSHFGKGASDWPIAKPAPIIMRGIRIRLDILHLCDSGTESFCSALLLFRFRRPIDHKKFAHHRRALQLQSQLLLDNLRQRRIQPAERSRRLFPRKIQIKIEFAADTGFIDHP